MSNNQSHITYDVRGRAPITVREGTAADDAALERLAQLDSRAVPAGPVLVAEVGGEVRAAIPVRGGEAIADPFHPTAELVAMLRLSASGTAASRTRGVRLLGSAPRRSPRPSAPSVPGIPALPSQRL
jgi:hypothetical protein